MIKEVTDCFLLRDNDICLGMKKRGFGVGLWNGTGGKIIQGESPKETTKREALEEFNINLNTDDLLKMAEIDFLFKDGLQHQAHIFVCRKWTGEPTESEEMNPKWFSVDNLPWENMWSTDRVWLPKVLGGKNIKGRFYFNDDGRTIEKFDIKEL